MQTTAAHREPLKLDGLKVSLTELDEASGQHIELGHPADWVREMVWSELAGALIRAPVAQTAAENWVALYDSDDVLVGVVWRWCPHKQEDLLAFASYGECPGAVYCKHAGYSWWASSGQLRTSGSTGAAGPIGVFKVAQRPDGSAYAVAPSAEAGAR